MNGRPQLRQFRESDLDALAAMVGDAQQMTFYPRAKTRLEALTWLRRNRSLYQEHGFGFWLIELLPRRSFAGYCGIRPLELDVGEAGQVHVPGARVGSAGVEQHERLTCAVDVPPGVDVAYRGVGAHVAAEGV